MTVGARIRSRRKECGLTLKMLSAKCGISVSFLSDIEHGRRNPSLDKLRTIAEGLDTTVSYLLGEEDAAQKKDESQLQAFYRPKDMSLEFREVLEKIEDFDSWSDEDKRELLTYLELKKKMRTKK